MHDVMQDIPLRGWVDIVGPDYEASFIGSESLHERNKRRPIKKRHPSARKLITPDGRRYKLVSVLDGSKKVIKILKRSEAVRDADFTPSLLWSDSHSLLYEYIDGEFPDPASHEFAEQLGKVLATVHKHQQLPLNKFASRIKFQFHLHNLHRQKLIESRHVTQAKQLYAAGEPKTLQSSLDYYDVKKTNFIVDRNGSLKLIDAGSFRQRGPTGYLLASPLFKLLPKEIFWQSYNAGTGNSYLQENQQFLQLYWSVFKAGKKIRLFGQEPDRNRVASNTIWNNILASSNSVIKLLESC